MHGLLTAELPMTAPHARQPQVLPRPACTPAAIRAVLAANVGHEVLQQYDEDLDMDAVVIVAPVQYQRRRDERDDVSMPLRTLHFGPHDQGLVTFLVYPLDDLVLVVRIQWLGD